MIILGIDPGYAIVGYGLISYQANRFRVLEYGAITTDAGLPLPRRLNKIYGKGEAPKGYNKEETTFQTGQEASIGKEEK